MPTDENKNLFYRNSEGFFAPFETIPMTPEKLTFTTAKLDDEILKKIGLRKDIGPIKCKVPMPKKYIINHGATVLIWKNGEKTVVKRCEDDEFNKRLGFLTAFFQHYCGMSKNKANKFLAELEVEDEETEETKKPKQMKDIHKNKFNIGDRVKLKDNISDTYGISRTTIKNMQNQIFTIYEISSPDDIKSFYSYVLEEVGYFVREDMIEKGDN